MLQIRTFEESDRNELLSLFGRAARESPGESLWGHEVSEASVYLVPYMDMETDSLFIALEGGTITGYLTGCIDSSRFPPESERIANAIREYRLMYRFRTVTFFLRSLFDIAGTTIARQPQIGDFQDPRWPAHLHINVVPEVRGKGVAAALMNRWLDRLREVRSQGCYLQTLEENTRAVRFFERMGFSKFGATPLVPGLRYHGRRVHQQTMVWSAEP